MPRRGSLCLLLAVLAACAAHSLSDAAPQQQPLEAGLAAEEDTRLWMQLIKSLRVSVDANATYATMFAPTDRAVMAFLAGMGLTMDELLKRPLLVDAILSYHLVPGVAIDNLFSINPDHPELQLFSTFPDAPTLMTTGDVNYGLSAFRSPTTGLVTLVDAQGNRALVVAPSGSLGNVRFWAVTRVLMSGGYFFSPGDAMMHYPSLSATMELLDKAALYSEPLAASFVGAATNTYLIPTNSALQRASHALAKAPAVDLAALLLFHIVPGIRPIPYGWRDGPVRTLLGANLTARLSTKDWVDPFTGAKQQAPSLTLGGKAGRPGHNDAQVTIPFNIYCGRSILHALDAALLPDLDISSTVLAGGEDGSARRRLLQAAAAPPAVPAPATRQTKANTWAAQNLQGAIRASSTGFIPASYAAAAGTRDLQGAEGGCINCLRWGPPSASSAAAVRGSSVAAAATGSAAAATGSLAAATAAAAAAGSPSAAATKGSTTAAATAAAAAAEG